MATEEESLTKVYIDLPQHWATGGGSMWALPLGGNLYEIRNKPFYAYGVNWGDIVRADSNGPKLKPEVREVEKLGIVDLGTSHDETPDQELPGHRLLPGGIIPVSPAVRHSVLP